jgi:hypothetical protein
MANAGTTAGSHWKNAYHSPLNTGIGAYTSQDTGVRDINGNDMRDEVMVGWSNAARWRNKWLGKFSVASLNDIGWDIDYFPWQTAIQEYRTNI